MDMDSVVIEIEESEDLIMSNEFYSTREVARIINVNVAALSHAVWDGRIEPPARSPSGSFLWTRQDIQRASSALRRRADQCGKEYRHGG